MKKVSLKGGKGKAFDFNIKSLPSTLADGTYHLLAEVVDSSEATNVTATTQTVQVEAAFVQPVVSVAGVTPATIALGKSGSILVTITNDGNVAASGVEITLSPSADGVTRMAGVVLVESNQKGVKIHPKGVKKFTLHFKVSSALAAGSYFPYVSVSLDSVLATAVGTTLFTVT